MSATGFCPPPAMRAAIPPTEEDTTFRHRRIQGEVQDENAWVLSGVAGHAGLFSNVPDLLRFSAEILHSAKSGPGQHPPFTSLFDGQSGAAVCRAAGTGRQFARAGLGHAVRAFVLRQSFSPHSIGHLGFSGCSLWIDLDAGIAVVLLTQPHLARPEDAS